MATLLTAIFMPFITYLYKMNQTRISGHRQCSIENLAYYFWEILENTDLLD